MIFVIHHNSLFHNLGISYSKAIQNFQDLFIEQVLKRFLKEFYKIRPLKIRFENMYGLNFIQLS